MSNLEIVFERKMFFLLKMWKELECTWQSFNGKIVFSHTAPPRSESTHHPTRVDLNKCSSQTRILFCLQQHTTIYFFPGLKLVNASSLDSAETSLPSKNSTLTTTATPTKSLSSLSQSGTKQKKGILSSLKKKFYKR